jgi:chromodomain-helicase-DNA-binding protein 1
LFRQILEGKLENKNREVMFEACDELIQICENAITQHKEEMKARQAAGETITSAMRQKAVLVSFRNISSINAETTAYRWTELAVVDQHLRRVPNPLKWAVPAEMKPTMNWSVPWSTFEDSRLLVGIWRHGFGSWEAIQNVSYSFGM